MRAKMQRMLDENRLLHLALQRTVSEELLGEGFGPVRVCSLC